MGHKEAQKYKNGPSVRLLASLEVALRRTGGDRFHRNVVFKEPGIVGTYSVFLVAQV